MTALGIAVAASATALLPPRTAAVATKTPAATALAGVQTTINNQLKVAAALAMKTAMMTATTMMVRMQTKVAAATAAAVAAVAVAALWQHGSGSGVSSG